MSYQPIVIEIVDKVIEGLIESDFFVENQIENMDFAKTYLLEYITKRYINMLSEGEDIVESITDDEWNEMLKIIIAGSVLEELRNKGLVDSITDENGEERFFLTEEGKRITI